MSIEELYQKTIKGDQRAEKELFQLLTARFRLFVHRKVQDENDGEEIVQDALLVVYNKYREMDFEVSLAGWAHKVLMHRIMNYYRSKKYRNAKAFNYKREKQNDMVFEPDPMFENQLRQCLEKIARKNRRHARILNFNYQGFSASEICRKLGLTKSNLYTILSRARDMLEKCLDKGSL